jgi:hypothetical protein
MNINEVFDSKYLRAADLQGKTPVVTITQIEMAKMQDGQNKPCIFLNNKPKGLVLNKTNATMIAKLYGGETDAWIGKQVRLITAWVEYQGDTVQAIRIRPPSDVVYTADTPAAAPVIPPAHSQDDYGALDDEVPF